MKTYKKLKKELNALQDEHGRREIAEDNYHRSGNYERMRERIYEASEELKDTMINMTGKTDAEILTEFLRVAETAASHEDFEDCGVVFPERCIDEPKQKIKYGLLTWVANLLKTNSAPILDDVQRAIDVVPHYVEGWSLSGTEFDGECDISTDDSKDYHFECKSPAIALTCCVLKATIDHPETEVFKLPGTE